MFRSLFAWIAKYENHLSAVAMMAGFVVDQIFFDRIDLPRTQLIFGLYILVCVVSIAALHRIEARVDQGVPRPRWRPILPLATQFALGGFWSGFLLFYGQSAVLSSSWPFLAILVVILIGNEVLRKYHDRLIFTNVLFFFALFSYAIFALPIYTGELGRLPFLGSGVLAIVAFALFLLLLYVLGSARLKESLRGIVVGSTVVFAMINVFYFTGVLPPLPLAAKDAGVYHSVGRLDGVYTARGEVRPWYARFGVSAKVHTVPGESLYAYSAVFAPIALTTRIVHEWQWYDSVQKAWVTRNSVSFPITGGRDGGYRGYSTKAEPASGKWRVNVKTADGRPIARITFTVTSVSLPPPLVTTILH